jgi:beta-glucanase (GH16 family)
MKSMLLLLLGSVSLVGLASDWKLVWSDEFDRPGQPDPKKWTYENGFVRNEELQFYTVGRRENARVENGCLVIEARREDWRNPKYQPKGRSWMQTREKALYTSASLTTENLASWQYGRFEIRAQVTAGKGTWPAIWMLGTNINKVGWPACGELDIMEFLGKDPLTIHGTIHYADPQKKGGHLSSGKSTKTTVPAANGFHLYAMEWNEKTIELFCDGQKYHSFDLDQAGTGPDNPFRKPQYLLLNLALGGWGGPIDDQAMPQRYIIDYVRVYAMKTPAATAKKP